MAGGTLVRCHSSGSSGICRPNMRDSSRGAVVEPVVYLCQQGGSKVQLAVPLVWCPLVEDLGSRGAVLVLLQCRDLGSSRHRRRCLE